MQTDPFQSVSPGGGSDDQAPTVRVSPSNPGAVPPPGYGTPPPQGYPPQPGYPSQPGFPPAQQGWNAPPQGFSGPQQPGYGPPPQGYPGQPGFPPPGPPGPRKKGRGGLIAIIAAVVVVVIIAGVAFAALGGKKSPTRSNTPGSTSTTTGDQPGNTPEATATATETSSSGGGTTPAGFTSYDGGLYTIAYPDDWSVDPSGSDVGTSSFTGQGLQVLQVDVEDEGDEDIGQYLTLYCQTLGDTNVGDPTTVTIGGQQWQKLVCKDADGQPMAEVAGVTYKDHLFTINTLSLANTYATDAPQYFQPMEESFAFTS